MMPNLLDSEPRRAVVYTTDNTSATGEDVSFIDMFVQQMDTLKC